MQRFINFTVIVFKPLRPLIQIQMPDLGARIGERGKEGADIEDEDEE
jgi:hypothetical protein